MLKGILVRVSINGAVVVPDEVQYSSILNFVSDTIFGKTSEPKEPANFIKITRKYNKAKTAKRYGVGEIRLIKARRAEGVGWAKIAKELHTVYGTKRTGTSVYQKFNYAELPGVKPVDPNALTPNNVQPLKQNEWGGIEGVRPTLN